jgi:hypothetical protein
MSEKFYDGVCADCKKNFEWSYFAQDVCNSCGIDRKEKKFQPVTIEVSTIGAPAPVIEHVCTECGEPMWFEAGKWVEGWNDKNGHFIKTDDGSDVAWWKTQPATGVRYVDEHRHEDRDDMGVFASRTGHSEN